MELNRSTNDGSEEKKGSLKDLTYPILVNWHTQFAENQRIREQSFQKILGFLGSIVLGYGYVFVMQEQQINYAVIIAMASIFFGAWQVNTIAYNFRRDQIVNGKIRKMAGVFGEDYIYPESYDPTVSPKGIISWIPDFLQPYYGVFVFSQLILLISYFNKTGNIYLRHSVGMKFSIILLGILTALPSLYYSSKLTRRKYIKPKHYLIFINNQWDLIMQKKNDYVLIAAIIAASVIVTLVNQLFIMESNKYPTDWFIRVSSAATALAAIFTIFAVIFAYRSMKSSASSLEETKRINEPAVSVKIAPDKDNYDFLNLIIQNTGGSAAYDVTVRFDPDLPYMGTYDTVNVLPKLKYIALLEKQERIEFFFSLAYDLESDSTENEEKNKYPKETTATICYNKKKKKAEEKKDVERKYEINLLENKGQIYVNKKKMNDLFKEIEELKHGLFILLANDKREST
ncbi:MAG: hypothetical protein HYV28_04435 [Ignavibacteriales bacterium]|nr:hypothetical protein [Ignavibacteriales bacterium]